MLKTVPFLLRVLLSGVLFSGILAGLEIEDIQIIPKTILDPYGYSGDLAVDFNTGDLHCIWVNSWGQLKYASRTFVGDWTPAEVINTNGLNLFADESDGTSRWARKCCGISLDEEGTIHIVYSVRDGDIYYIFGSSGQWSEPYRVISRGHVSCHPEIVAMNGNLVIIWEDAEDSDVKEFFEICRLNGVWMPHKVVMMADNPDLIKGENGMVYLTGRLFNTRWPDYDYDHNVLFGSMIPGFRDWEITQVTNETYRLGKASRLCVFNETIYLSWSISLGAEAIDDWDEKGRLYCATASEPGKEWQIYLNDNRSPVYTTATGDPYAAVAAYSDETLFYTNGKAGVLATNSSRFFRLWLGDHWSGIRLAEWENGIVHLASDGKTVWAIASSSAYNNREVSVSGYLNPDADYFHFGNKPPVFTQIPGDAAISGSLWQGQCQAIDPEDDPVTYQLTVAPDECVINPSTGVIQWQTAGSDSQLIGIKASDDRGGHQVRYFYLHLTRETVKADFMADQPQGTAPVTVQFTSLSQGEIDSYLWSFGDGMTSTLADPIHIYQQPGLYTVQLLVSGQVASDSLSRADYISVSASPVMPRFAADPISGNAPLTVLFSDSSTGDITEWQWDFGDGGGSTDQNPVHIYLNPGSYDVSLTVRGPFAENRFVYPGRITVLTSAPEADFEASPVTGGPGIPVQFTDRSSGQIDEWLWDFGDGQTSELQHPVHIYDSTGVYSVMLTVNGAGGSDTIIHENVVQVGLVPPHASFTAEPLEGEAPLSVKFFNHSTGSSLTYSWYFGDYYAADGGMSHEENPVYIYQMPGVYSVILNIFGPEDSDVLLNHQYIRVIKPVHVEEVIKPDRYALYQNNPNPFNSQTRFTFELPQTDQVCLDVFDSRGQAINSLMNESKAAGRYTVVWDGRDTRGEPVPSGIYIVRMTAGRFSAHLKMNLIR
jgi:PKD repeat protein